MQAPTALYAHHGNPGQLAAVPIETQGNSGSCRTCSFVSIAQGISTHLQRLSCMILRGARAVACCPPPAVVLRSRKQHTSSGIRQKPAPQGLGPRGSAAAAVTAAATAAATAIGALGKPPQAGGRAGGAAPQPANSPKQRRTMSMRVQDLRSLRLRQRGSDGCGRVASGGSRTGGADVERQLDGLPRLPSHLSYHEHYDAEEHCPVCSLGELPLGGREKQAGGGNRPRVCALAAPRGQAAQGLAQAALVLLLLAGRAHRVPSDASSPKPPVAADDGGAHEPGRPSHAAELLLQRSPTPPPLRSIDEHGLALMLSLQRPKAGPTWWGERWAGTQVGHGGRPGGEPGLFFGEQ